MPGLMPENNCSEGAGTYLSDIDSALIPGIEEQQATRNEGAEVCIWFQGYGETRSHKAGCRPAPTRPPTMFISIPLVKFDLETSLETRCKPLLPYFVLPAAHLYPESGMNCY